MRSSEHLMSEARRRRGRLGEDAAARFLRGEGYAIVARNWSRPCGEIDLVAREPHADGDTLVIVEVKTRRADPVALPEEAIDWRKRRALGRAARAFAAELRDPSWRAMRIDAVAVEVDDDDRVVALRHFRDIA